MSNWRLLIIVILFFAAAAVSLFYNLDGWMVADDEACYLYPTWRVSEGGLPYRDVFLTQTPFIHLTAGMLFRLFGVSLVLARGLVAVLTLGTVILVYLIGRTIYDARAGLLASVIFLINPLVFRYGRNFQPDLPYVFFYCLGVFIFLRCMLKVEAVSASDLNNSSPQSTCRQIIATVFMEQRSSIWWVLIGVVFGLAVVTKLYGIYAFGGILLFLVLCFLFRKITMRQMLRSSLLLGVGGFVVFALFAVFFLLRGTNPHDIYYCIVGHFAEKHNPPRTLKVFEQFYGEYRLLVILAALGLLWSLGKRRRAESFFICNLVMVLLFFKAKAWFEIRHLMFVLPFLSLLVAGFIFFIVELISRWFFAGRHFFSPVLEQTGFGKIKLSYADTSSPSGAFWQANLLFLFAFLLITVSLGHTYFPVDARPLLRREQDTMQMAQFIASSTKEGDYILGDYPSFCVYARRLTPPRLTDLSSTATRSGLLTADDLIYGCEKYHVQLVFLHVEGGRGHDYGAPGPHHIIPSLRGLNRFKQYLANNFTLVKTMVRAGQVFDIFIRKEKEIENGERDEELAVTHLNLPQPVRSFYWDEDKVSAERGLLGIPPGTRVGGIIPHWQMGQDLFVFIQNGEKQNEVEVRAGQMTQRVMLKAKEVKWVSFIPENAFTALQYAVSIKTGPAADCCVKVVSDPYTIGLAFLKMRQWEEAVYHLMRARASNPDNLEVNYLLGRALAEKGEWEKALEKLQLPAMINTRWEKWYLDPDSTMEEFAGVTEEEWEQRVAITLEAEDLPGQLGRREDDEVASGGKSRLYLKGEEPESGYLVFGPYCRLPTGDYRAVFSLKLLDSVPDTVVCEIDVNKRQRLAGKVIESKDFLRLGEYQDFTLNFSYNEEDFPLPFFRGLQTVRHGNLEFRVKATGMASILVDNITIYPVLKTYRQHNGAAVHGTLATAYELEGENDYALAELEQALLLTPGDISNRRRLGELYEQREEWGKAVKVYRELTTIYPEELFAWERLANIFTLTGHDEDREFVEKRLAALREVHKVLVNFDGQIGLLEYNLSTHRLRRGEVFKTTYGWERLGLIDKDYYVFVHFQKGEVLFQNDHKVLTSNWREGEIIREEFEVLVPDDIPAGDYEIGLGLWDPYDTKERLPVVDSAFPIEDNKVIVGRLRIVE